MAKPTLLKRAIELDREVNRYVQRQSFQAWMDLNLTAPQLKTLFFISNKGATTPRQLASALHVTPSNVTGIVERLVEQGLVSREGKPEDRRVSLLRSTQQGESILAGLRERRISTLREVFSRLSEEELEDLVSGLSALARSTQAFESADDQQALETV